MQHFGEHFRDSVRVAGMARVAFDRAIAGMGTPQKKADDAASTETAVAAGGIDPNESVIVLTDEIQAVRMHQLAISLRPLPGTTGRPMLTASRWEVRKAIMSLCCTPPTMFEVNLVNRPAVAPEIQLTIPTRVLEQQQGNRSL